MSDQKTQLKQCPCGMLPTDLDVIGLGSESTDGMMATVLGICCGEWAVPFQTGYTPIDSAECKARAVAAWNAAPRSVVRKHMGAV